MNQQNQLRLVEEDLSPPAPLPDPLIGRVLDGRYLIEKVLGEGGMGIVYRAKHTALGKPLAVKVLRAEVSKDREIVARFRQEAQSATAIGNEHIIDISDFGVLPDGSTYFVMEFLEGVSLTQAIEADRPVPAARIVGITKQICTALGAAHEAGIVHRDLKPDNIYLIKRSGDSDFVKVLDFGIAKVGGATSKLTRAGQVFGTPHYMSPEQCAGTNVDPRTDIYALGVILYEMASGHVPFDADNLMGILTKHLYENPIPLHELPPPTDVLPALESVIMKALEKKPEHRYQTMLEMRADLERIEQGLAPQAVMDAVDRASRNGATERREDTEPRNTGIRMRVGKTQESASKRLNSLPLLLGGGLALMVVLGGVAAFVFHSGADDETDITPLSTAPPALPLALPLMATSLIQATAGAGIAATGGAAMPATVRVTITSTPAGAAVYRGADIVGNTPFKIERPLGDATIDLSLRVPGYEDQSIRISSSSQRSMRIPLERERRATGGGGRRAARAGQPPRDTPPTQRARAEGGRAYEVLNPWDQ